MIDIRPFASLGGAPMVTALTIGSSGNIVVGLSFPTCTLTGTLIRAVTPFGGFVLTVGTVVACMAMPFICPLIATMVALMSFVLTNITVITATSADAAARSEHGG